MHFLKKIAATCTMLFAFLATGEIANAVPSYTLVNTIANEDASSSDLFGLSLDIEGRNLVATGRTFVTGFDMETGARWFRHDNTPGLNSGQVALGGGQVYYGSRGETVDGVSRAGRLEMFETLTGTSDPFKPILTVKDYGAVPAADQRFGTFAATDGTSSIVSSLGPDGTGTRQTAIFEYAPGVGAVLQTLVDDSAGAVAIDGAQAFAFDRNTGAIKVLNRTAGVWSGTPVQTIERPVGATAQYGTQVKHLAFDAATGLLAIGDTHYQVHGVQAGAVFVYQLDPISGVFVLHQIVHSPVVSDAGMFGSSVAIENGRLIVGERETGAAYMFLYNEGTSFIEAVHQFSPGGRLGDVAVQGGIVAVSNVLGFTETGVSAGYVNIYLEEGAAFPAVAPVPLPATGLLLLAALAGMSALRRRA